MGCNACRPEPSNERTTLLKRVMDYIEKDDITNLSSLLKVMAYKEKTSESILINKRIIPLKNLMMNCLAYAVWLGRAKSYTFFVENIGASVEIMEEIFLKENMSAISLICERGFLDLLKQYLPRYLQTISLNPEKSLTISFSNKISTSDGDFAYTPIQIACKLGYTGIVHYLADYFSDVFPPPQLDVHYVNEVSGENCALISAKTGNFIMIKMLYETAGADFTVKNKNNEGVIQIIAAAAKSKNTLQYLECLMYFIEVIKIDISYMYDETLLLLEQKLIIKYFEDKLRLIGICASKEEVEIIFKSNRKREPELPSLREISIIEEVQNETPFVENFL